MKSRVVKIGVPLLLALAAYFAAGFFVDLPPYGILPEEIVTRITLNDGAAQVDTGLRYICRSWRPRRNSLYLPFSPGGVTVEDFRCEITEPSRYALYPDGVMLHLVMEPYSDQSATFHFVQKLKEKRYQHLFDVGIGWGRKTTLPWYDVDLPAEWKRVRFSILPAGERLSRDGRRKTFSMEGQEGKGLTISWE